MKTAEKQAIKKVRIPKAHDVSVASRVRYLANEKGMARADIARQLDIRYQRVRNVLVPKAKAVETELEATESEDTLLDSEEPTSEVLEQDEQETDEPAA